MIGAMDGSIATLYPDWAQYAARLRDGVRDLTETQLAIRAGPDHGTIWQLAAHCAGTRVYWLCHIFGEPGADRTPFTDPSGMGWEALDSTWAIVAHCLARWTVDDLEVSFERRLGDVVQHHTRASILNRLCSHDAFHAGEISQLLGVHGLPPIDLWRRTPT
jgi:hypothetical protein